MVQYATAVELATYMGRSPFTGGQITSADLYLAAASAWIDRHTGRTWNPASPTTEKQTVIGRYLYLKNKPVTAITSINARYVYPGAASALLTVNIGFELLDAAKGQVLLADYGAYPYSNGETIVTVVYTHTATLPENIKLATLILASTYMNSTLNPGSQRIRSFNDNRAVSVTFKDDAVPESVVALLPPKQAFIV